MSRSSARIASKLPTKSDGVYEEAPIMKQTSEKKSAVKIGDGMAPSISRRTIITTSESSAEEFHSMDEEEEILPTQRRKLFQQSRSETVDVKKEEEFAPSDDIFFARSKLDAVLAHISHGEQEGVGDDYDSDCELSPPAKSLRRTRPRKPRKLATEDGRSKTPALVLKLFDRAVDLAKFCNLSRREVPLYPVCREWIHNQQEPVLIGSGDSGQIEKGVGFLHRLPEPLPVPDVYIENELSPRIPLGIVKPTIRKEDVDDKIINSNMNHTELMDDNMKRWKSTRNEWREAGKRNDARYNHSCAVLKSMYEKSTLAEPMIEPKLEPLDN